MPSSLNVIVSCTLTLYVSQLLPTRQHSMASDGMKIAPLACDWLYLALSLCRVANVTAAALGCSARTSWLLRLRRRCYRMQQYGLHLICLSACLFRARPWAKTGKLQQVRIDGQSLVSRDQLMQQIWGQRSKVKVTGLRTVETDTPRLLNKRRHTNFVLFPTLMLSWIMTTISWIT